jgi:hypothetical protein
MNDAPAATSLGCICQDWGAMDLPPAVTRRGKSTLRFKSRNVTAAGNIGRGHHGPGFRGLLRRPSAWVTAALVVIKVDAGAYLVQAVARVGSQVSELDQWVEVDMPMQTCTGLALACTRSPGTRSNRGECGGGWLCTSRQLQQQYTRGPQ